MCIRDSTDPARVSFEDGSEATLADLTVADIEGIDFENDRKRKRKDTGWTLGDLAIKKKKDRKGDLIVITEAGQQIVQLGLRTYKGSESEAREAMATLATDYHSGAVARESLYNERDKIVAKAGGLDKNKTGGVDDTGEADKADDA
eukprot:14610725-Alexandrium_andersonii.AAC.1